MYLCVIHAEVKRNNRKSETDVMFRLVSMTWVNYKQVLEGSGGRLYGNFVCVDVPECLFGRANKVSRSRRTCSCTYFIIILLLSVRPSSAAQQQWIQFPMIARPGEKYFAARTWPFSHHRLSKLGYIFFFLVSLLSFLLDVGQPIDIG